MPNRLLTTALLLGVAATPVVVATASAAASSATPSVVRADEGPATWSVQPATRKGPDSRPRLDLAMAPGSSYQDHVAVKNLSGQKLRLDLYASDAFTTESGGYDLLAAVDEPVDVGSWITLDRDKVVLEPRSQKIVGLTIDVPDNASPGDHSGGIVAAFQSAGTTSELSDVSVDTRVGTRVYLRVDGPLDPSLEIVDYDVTYQGSLNPLQSGRTVVAYTVRNTGNIRLGADAALRTSGAAGLFEKDTGLAAVSELLPGAEYSGESQVAGIWPTIRINAELRLDPTSTSAALTIPPTTRSASAWALPWGLIAVGAAICIAIPIVIAQRRWRRRSVATPGSRAV